jgi:hypothetical protein
MQNKNIDPLDQYSIEDLQNHIYARRNREARAKEEEFKNRIKSELELKFDNCLKQFNIEYTKQLNVVKEQFNKLTDISEQYGIPFEFSIFELFGESDYKHVRYNPKSFGELWSELNYQILHANQVYRENSVGWNTSSLLC